MYTKRALESKQLLFINMTKIDGYKYFYIARQLESLIIRGHV